MELSRCCRWTGPPIAYAPSAAVLVNLARRRAAGARASQPVLTLGDPHYTPFTDAAPIRVEQRSGMVRVEERFRAGLSRLPHSGAEAGWVKQLFDKAGMPALLLTGTRATEAQLRSSITGREIVHLACHGMADHSFGNFFGGLAIASGTRDDPRDDSRTQTPNVGPCPNRLDLQTQTPKISPCHAWT